MGTKYFPLRWESTGDKWWYASPIDWAAANGHYDLVRSLLHIDTNLLIKLTSLPRIRRLETVWDDDEDHISKCRSQVAYKLLQDCETKENGRNSLIGAGYGGWLLYTAASAGDVAFVKELLGRDPLLVFGEGEYGVTDMLYAAARGKSCDVFMLLFEFSMYPGGLKEVSSVYWWEIMNRAVHAAARGGDVVVLRELLGGGDVLGYRDGRGSTVLHSASGRGQVEVVKHLISSYDIVNSVDNRGNTSLHVAAYRGQLAIVELLTSTSPSTSLLTNNYGDTFLHMAVLGFCSPSFSRMDRQKELMKRLVSGKLAINMENIINIQNNDGRTVLHVAVVENVQSDIVELLMSVRYINLNIRDADGYTPLDLLKQQPRSATSKILIKRIISAGAISNCQDEISRNALASHLRMHGIIGSPGISFRIPDAEIFLYTGVEDLCSHSSCDLTSSENGYSGEIECIRSNGESNSSKYKKFASMSSSTTKRLKNLLRWQGKSYKSYNNEDLEDSCSIDLISKNSIPLPLRLQFSKQCSFLNNKRIMSFSPVNNLPSLSAKKRFAAGLRQGVLQVVPKSYFGSPSSAFSESSWSSRVSDDKQKGVSRSTEADNSPKMRRKHGSFNLRLMNSYLCFGAQSLDVEKSVNSPRRKSQKQESVVV